MWATSTVWRDIPLMLPLFALPRNMHEIPGWCVTGARIGGDQDIGAPAGPGVSARLCGLYTAAALPDSCIPSRQQAHPGTEPQQQNVEGSSGVRFQFSLLLELSVFPLIVPLHVRPDYLISLTHVH